MSHDARDVYIAGRRYSEDEFEPGSVDAFYHQVNQHPFVWGCEGANMFGDDDAAFHAARDAHHKNRVEAEAVLLASLRAKFKRETERRLPGQLSLFAVADAPMYRQPDNRRRG
ncbi:MAG: hypothetical protein [Microvirus sp.]|nr:MAG: hypothetical protein [Microvirus sp.]